MFYLLPKQLFNVLALNLVRIGCFGNLNDFVAHNDEQF